MTTVISNNLALTDIKTIEGNTNKIIMATASIENKTINVTWDCNNNNLVVHNWYDLSDVELAYLTVSLSEWFKTKA